jgi:hypothetical protein
MHKIVDAVNLFLVVVGGVFLMALVCRTGDLAEFLAGLAQGVPGALLFLVGLAAVVGNAIVGIRELRGGDFRRNLLLTTEEGVNTVNIRALEQQLLQELQKAPDVMDAAVAMEARGEGVPLACRLSFKLRRQENVMRRVDELKKAVREAFVKLIPAGATIEIVANVRDLVGENEAGLKQESEFLGPRYPVGEGENG